MSFRSIHGTTVALATDRASQAIAVPQAAGRTNLLYKDDTRRHPLPHPKSSEFNRLLPQLSGNIR